MNGSNFSPLTIVCHVSVDIACSVDRLWQKIKDGYIRGTKFSEQGYAIERLDDPISFLGSFRMSLEQDGIVVDERVVHVNELDESLRRTSLHADYLSESSNGLEVFATYQALPIPTGARYIVDCHAHFRKWPAPSDNASEIRAAIEDLKSKSEGALVQFLEGVKAELEAA